MQKSYENASKLIAGAVKKLQCEILETRDLGNPKDIDPPISNFSKSNYLKAVEKAKEYITAGDIFQVVPSQRWTQDFKLPPFPYTALCAEQIPLLSCSSLILEIFKLSAQVLKF